MAEESEEVQQPIESASLDPQGPEEPAGAKWFVILFLLVVPALGFVLVVSVAWALWKAWF